MNNAMPTIIDRSTAERYSTCPLMARLSEERMQSVDAIAESGTAVHDAISGAIDSYIRSGGSLSRNELAEQIERNALETRSDLLPDALKALKYSTYKIAEHISDIHHTNILAFDGGEDLRGPDGSLSGQLFADLPALNVRLTCEVDLLCSTKTEGLLALDDWKSGWKQWTESQVAESFQFQWYAYLVLDTFPDIRAVDVTIWNTRRGTRTDFPTRFKREELDPIKARIMAAAGDYLRWHARPMEAVEARPTREGCRLCSCAAECTVCDRDISEIKSDPIAAVDRMFAIQRTLDEYQATLKTVCTERGEIITPAGNAFGFQRPKQTRKPTAELYAVKGATTDEQN